MSNNKSLRDIMTEKVVSLHEEDSLNIVNKTLEKHNFHHIPIVNINKSVVGMVSRTDLLRLAAIRDQFSEKEFNFLKIKDIMTHKVTCMSPNESVSSAATLFMDNHFHAIPLVEDEKLVGIVTTHDLIKYAFADN
jgi:CBS domain-containing protein